MVCAAPCLDDELPNIDDRLVEPQTPYEMYDGELVRVSPADPPHGTRHVQVAALVEAHVGPAFEVAAELLTRTSARDDFAPDVSVYPDAPHPRTGRRQLEQLTFEIVSTERMSRAARKAGKLARRGVRRVFAIDVEHSRALEWSAARRTWRVLDPGGSITDPALEVPLPIAALIHAARTDDAIARALLAKRNPVIEAVRAKDRARSKARGRIEGKIEGKIESLLAILSARNIALDRAARNRIRGERDPGRLDRWTARAAIAATIADVLADG